MKLPLLTPLCVLLLAVSASAVTLDAPPSVAPAADVRTVRDSVGADLERELAGLERDENAAKLELSDLARESELLKARTLARGRAYTRLARAGLLPVGGGFIVRSRAI